MSELIYGSLRRYYSLTETVDAYLDRPLRGKDQIVYALLLVGAYQLLYTRIPDHAAINETVGATRDLNKPWARGLVNAVLRKVADARQMRSSDGEPYDHSVELPEWMLARLRDQFPDQVDALGAAAVERAPMSLRVNASRIRPENYRQKLRSAGIEFHPGNFPEHLILEKPVPVGDLPGYREGEVSVQDAGAQFAAHLCPHQQRHRPRLLDACAAPGGKLFHLAERYPEAELIGLELSPERLAHMQQEAARLGHGLRTLRLLAGDASGREWRAAEERFDFILLDAPCSGSGTLRRHPDIKVLRKSGDVAAAAALQLAMLKNLWPLVAPGGSLLYCTCSLFAEENDQVIDAFLNHWAGEPANAAPTIDNLELPVGIATRFGWQLLPLPAADRAGEANRTVDGFYFARMTRQEKAR